MTVLRALPLLLAGFLAAAPGRAEEGRDSRPLGGAYLGVQLRPGPAGPQVVSVTAGSAAERAGLVPGDVLERLGPLEELAAVPLERLVAEVRRLEPGRPLEVAVVRRGQHETLVLVPDPAALADADRLLAALRGSRYLRSQAAARAVVERLEADLPARVRACATVVELDGVFNEALGELGLSHASFVPPWTYRAFFAGAQRGAGSPHLGVILKRLEVGGAERYFVESLMAGGPAALGGLLVGDEVVALAGVPAGASPRRLLAGFEASRGLYTIRVEPGERLELHLRRRPGEAPRPLALAAGGPLGGLEATVRSARLLESPCGPVGYLHLWSCLPSRLPRTLRELLSGPLRRARALAVDLRGRGGQVAVLLEVEKVLEEDGRLLALLADRETRSAKEVLAWRLKRRPGVLVVGERTAGAVRPARHVELPGGGVVTLPGSPRPILKLTDGVDLEGSGVEPDVRVSFPLPYAAGQDPILERAVELLVRRLPRARGVAQAF